MGSPLSIPLQVNPPQQQPGALQNIGALMQLKTAIGEQQLRQAQMQNIAAEAQQRQRDLADQNTVQQAQLDPEASARLHTGDFSDVAGKIQPKTLAALQQQQQAFMSTKLAQTKEQNELQSEAQGNIVNTLQGLKSTFAKPDGSVDLDRVNQAWPDAIAHLQATGAIKNAGVTAQIPAAITDPKQIDQFIASVGGGKAATDAALAQQKAQAEILSSTAEARVKTAEAAKQENLNAMVKGIQQPGAAEARAETIVPAAQYPDLHAQLVKDIQGATTPEAIQAAQTRASEAAVGRSPQTTANKATQEAATARARAPFEEAVAAANAAQQHALSQGDTASAKYYESLQDVNHSLGTAKILQNVVNLSKGEHNEIAAGQLKALVPEYTNAIQDIKRMGASQGDAGLGSLAGHLQSEFTSLTQGKPLSNTLINEIAPYVQTIANGAVMQHNGNVAAIQKAYPGKLSPDQSKPEPLPYSSPAMGNPSATQSGGIKKVASKSDFDALPAGSLYINARDGKQYRKPLGAQ